VRRPTSILTLALLLSAACAAAPPADEAPVEPAPPMLAWTDPPGADPYTEALRADHTAALLAMGPDYVPRTEHRGPDGAPTFTNRLIRESSPYLHQHAHNPVDWYPWGDEAFEVARLLDRPVLLSIGYSTCHWCHVMERESFEDLEIAEYINAHFIAIKVDREERPDVDAVYMAAVQALTGRGGWPMTTVLDADGRPFFGGTYFPARTGDRGSRQGFLQILTELQAAWTGDRAGLLQRAERLSRAVARRTRPGPAGDFDRATAREAAAATFLGAHDTTYGGFSQSKKFPRPSVLLALLRQHRRTGDAALLDAVTRTLDGMMVGGIRDHVGGGFHRYTVERTWLVPHFEKMLYDNAQLTTAYLEASQATGRADYAAVARETLDYVDREMSDRRGGFYSATDADSPGPRGEDEEGWFFTWTPAELSEQLGPERAERFAARYGVTERGNFEGRNILFTRGRPLADVAAGFDLSEDELAAELREGRAVLYAHRATRPPPGLDDKVVASWNGLMISAFVRGGVVLGDRGYLRRAEAAADFLLENMRREDGRLVRAWRDGVARSDGVLEDYAFVEAALLDLFEATGDPRWLREALALQAVIDGHFADAESGGYFVTPDDGPKLLVRGKPDRDGALPSGNSVAALNLLRLSELTGDERFTETADRLFGAFARPLTENPTGLPQLLVALDWAEGPVKEIVLVAPTDVAEAAPMLEALRTEWLPNRVVVLTTEAARPDLVERVPLLEDRPPRDGKATAYVCERRVCLLPTTDPAVFARQLRE